MALFKRLARIAAFAALFILLWSLPYGPLFPWSPFKPGYDHLTLARADVYWPKGRPLEPAYRRVDQMIEQTERYQGFSIPKRITVVECADWNDFFRFAPMNRTHAVAGLTIVTGTEIYITPKSGEKKLDTGEFLLHEISHACLDQNSALWRAFKMNKWAWVMEGIAVSNGRQKAYLTLDEFIAQARTVPFPLVIGPKLDELPEPRNMRFNYVAWRYFLEFMRKTRGEPRFHSFLQAFVDSPDDALSSFEKAYGTTVAVAAEEFQNQVRGGNWHDDRQ